jgi:putative oxidoreductase
MGKRIISMEKIKTLMATDAGFGALVLRVPIGIILAAHGAQKLFGWFGGYGLEGVGGWFDSIGLSPGVALAFLAGSAEFFGGLLLIVGLLTRPAAIAAAFTMLVAILAAHLSAGLFLPDGYEFALALFAATVALAIQGAGSYSIDQSIASSSQI